MLQLIGTVWPLVTFPLTAAVASSLTGRARWYALFLVPVVSMFPCVYFADELANNGNLLFALIFGVASIAWLIYYPFLIVFGIFKLRK